MIKPDYSVVVTTYNKSRTPYLDKILKGWLGQKEKPEVILANGGEWYDTVLPIKQFRYYPDPGNKIRFAAAVLTRSNFIILADDDIQPLPGFIEDLHIGWRSVEGGIVGIFGRIFKDRIYKNNPVVRADKINKPVKVGFVGVIYFCSRKYINFELRGLKDRAVDDLYWQMAIFPDDPKHVIPSKNYRSIPEIHNDPDCIWRKPESREYRQKFFETFYRG